MGACWAYMSDRLAVIREATAAAGRMHSSACMSAQLSVGSRELCRQRGFRGPGNALWIMRAGTSRLKREAGSFCLPPGQPCFLPISVELLSRPPLGPMP